MAPAVQLAVIALTMCALLLAATQQYIASLRADLDGWRRIAIEIAATCQELRRGY